MTIMKHLRLTILAVFLPIHSYLQLDELKIELFENRKSKNYHVNS
jgi:hypothetical protein